jgi:xylulose-5-phosphate/fructose-6-phosphate phosphoketolase
MQDAIAHCARGLSTWQWASNDHAVEPDVVLACAGDCPTLETVAAAWWLRQHLPELKVRVVNVVDLMTLYPPYLHPHGMDNATFVEHFTEDKPVVFAFHDYPRAVHEVVHGRPNVLRFHVRGFNEEGTTTTPFDMVVLNGMSRYHLCIEAMRRAIRLQALTPPLIAECNAMLNKHQYGHILKTCRRFVTGCGPTRQDCMVRGAEVNRSFLRHYQAILLCRLSGQNIGAYYARLIYFTSNTGTSM